MDLVDKIQFVYDLYDFEGMQAIPYDTLSLLFRSAAKGLSKICSSEILSFNTSLLDVILVDSLSNPFSPTLNNRATLLTNYVIVLEYCCSHPIILSWLKFFPRNEIDVPRGIYRGYDELGFKNYPQSTHIYHVRTALDQQKGATTTASSDFDNYYTPSVRAVTVQVAKFEKEKNDNEEKEMEEEKEGEKGVREDINSDEEQEMGVRASHAEADASHVDKNDKGGVEKDNEEMGDRVDKGEGEEKGRDAGEETKEDAGDADNVSARNTGDENNKDNENEIEDEDIDGEVSNVDADIDMDVDVDVDGIVEDNDDLSLDDDEEEEEEEKKGEALGEMIPSVMAKLLKTPYPFDSVNYNK